MTQTGSSFPPDLGDLSRREWLAALRDIGTQMGFSEPLGPDHAGVFVEAGDTLLVSFESVSGIETLSDTRTPIGFEMVSARDWSVLSVLCHRETWFRAPELYDFFDQLQDDGFFDDFETVIFYGAGPCGYAAAAYSVAAPGAKVLLVQPQATLDPRVTEWDDRFPEMRSVDFTSRYGYAPDMLDAADAGYVLYDPREPLDAMHAALFRRPNVTRFRMPSMGSAIQGDLLGMGILEPMLDAVAEDRLDAAEFAQLYRARREHSAYLRRLMYHVDRKSRFGLTRMLCENVVQRLNFPRFRRRLNGLKAQEQEQQDQQAS